MWLKSHPKAKTWFFLRIKLFVCQDRKLKFSAFHIIRIKEPINIMIRDCKFQDFLTWCFKNQVQINRGSELNRFQFNLFWSKLVHLLSNSYIFHNPLDPFYLFYSTVEQLLTWQKFAESSILQYETKVIRPKYSKHWSYLLAATVDFGWCKILNHDLNHGLFHSLLKVFKF